MPAKIWALLDAAAGPRHDDDLVRARRTIELFGLPFELVCIPERAERGGVPGSGRPVFAPAVGERIRRDEAFWRGAGLVATPNRYPFFARQLLLWPERAWLREPDEAFLTAAFDLAATLGASLVVNSIGASASVSLVHAHLLERPSSLLPRLPLIAVRELPGVRFLATDPSGGVPALCLGVEAAEARERARWVRRLLDLRRSAAFNLLAQGRSAWIFPRRSETPAPWFPFALGGGELWGRFVYPDEASYRAGESARLERALEESLIPVSPGQLEGLAAALPDRP